MSLSPSDFHTYHSPSRCELRVYLSHIGVSGRGPNTFEQFLMELGITHEKTHLESHPDVVDLSGEPRDERTERTTDEVQGEAPVIYQAALKSTVELGNEEYQIVGDPDFLIKEGGGYVIRDSKIAFNPEDSKKIRLQLQLYGWLYEQTFGEAPVRLEIHNGLSELVEVDYDGGRQALDELGRIVLLKDLEKEPYSPVGWTKCNTCAYMDHCWPRAVKRQDVATVYGIDQPLVRALREEGIETVDELLDAFDEESLGEFEKPHGERRQRVGKKASSIMRMARALATGNEEPIKKPEIPDRDSYVMFDLEGVPRHLDTEQIIFLWGLQVFGEKNGEFIAATSSFHEDGDLEGWKEFLREADAIFAEHGDIPFVHWASYEVGMLNLYLDRYGDVNGIAERVKDNLLDLFTVTRDSIALPVHSYSLKVIEKYIGFERSQEEYGGNWAMAKYIEALESEDEDVRQNIMDEILLYNKEDLEATWVVLEWLKRKSF